MRHQLTKHDIEQMEKEIAHRKLVVRPELLEHVKTARAHGDLSENFEYHAAKKEKNRNDSRIRYLERMIKTAQTIEEEAGKEMVGLNTTVTLYMEEEQEEERISLVTTVHVNMLENRISIESPMGKALLGHKVGDRVYIAISESDGYYVSVRKIEPFLEDLPLNVF